MDIAKVIRHKMRFNGQGGPVVMCRHIFEPDSTSFFCTATDASLVCVERFFLEEEEAERVRTSLSQTGTIYDADSYGYCEKYLWI